MSGGRYYAVAEHHVHAFEKDGRAARMTYRWAIYRADLAFGSRPVFRTETRKVADEILAALNHPEVAA